MHIDITLKNYRCFSDTNPARISIGPGFTAFVGVNNSGKSSLLKFFYEFRDLFGQLASSDNLKHFLKGGQRGINFGDSVLDTADVFCNYNVRDLELEFGISAFGESREHQTTVGRLVITVPRDRNVFRATILLPGRVLTSDDFSDTGGTTLQIKEGPALNLAPFARLFQVLHETVYIGSFRNAINIGTNQKYFDIQVGEAFIQEWRAFKTGTSKKQNEAAYQVTEGIQRIFEYSDLEINPSLNNQTLQIFIDGKSYWLSELGSGIAQFILVLANAATKQPTYILIDEPELNLHSSLQLDFLTTLGSFASEGVVFATHSIGLARASADVVYSLRKSDSGTEVRPLEGTPSLSEFLGELSFSGYRELGFDGVLLVEGTTEVKTVQQFLRQYRKDHQIVLLPLGGGQLIRDGVEAELEEIKRISENISVLIDSEKASSDASLEPSRAAFVEVCRKADINCHVLEYRATENYLTDRAVKKVKGDKYRALEPYELLRDVSHGWAKSENWKIAREMTTEELDSTDLGQFLKSL